jgi:nicotinamidase-related amidase
MHETQSRPAGSWKFTPANTAVVVVDMQNIWVHPRGARYLPSSEDIVQWSNFEGTPGAEIYEPLKPMQDDIVVKKFRYSGFYATQLENLLRALGRDTIAITGVATNVCCDSTARDGAMRDFKVSFCRIAAHLFRRKSRMRP